MDGISDQGLMSWSGNVTDAGSSTGFPAFFAGSLVGQPPSHIKLARYVVQWDVMLGAGYQEELANLSEWYAHAVALGLTPDVALDNYNCTDCSAPQSVSEYTAALEALLGAFPAIEVLEAWNEPNNTHYTSYLAPAQAAVLMNAADALCDSHHCTAIAGDFLDSEPNLVEYEHEYERYLMPADPGDWGIHPYHAVKYTTEQHGGSVQGCAPRPD